MTEGDEKVCARVPSLVKSLSVMEKDCNARSPGPFCHAVGVQANYVHKLAAMLIMLKAEFKI